MRFRRVVAALNRINFGQFVERCRDVGMVGAEFRLADGQDTRVQRFRFAIATARRVKPRQIYQVPCKIGMFAAKRTLADRQRARVARRRVVVAVLASVQRRQEVEQDRIDLVLATDLEAREFDRRADERFGLGVPALCVQNLVPFERFDEFRRLAERRPWHANQRPQQ